MVRIMRLASLRRARSNCVTSCACSRRTGSPITRMSLRASRCRRERSCASAVSLIWVVSLMVSWYPRRGHSHCGSTSSTTRTPPAAYRSRFAASQARSASRVFPVSILSHHPAGVAAALAPKRAGTSTWAVPASLAASRSAVNRPATSTLSLDVPERSRPTRKPGRRVPSSRRRSAPPRRTPPPCRLRRARSAAPFRVERLHDDAPRRVAAAAAPPPERAGRRSAPRRGSPGSAG